MDWNVDSLILLRSYPGPRTGTAKVGAPTGWVRSQKYAFIHMGIPDKYDFIGKIWGK